MEWLCSEVIHAWEPVLEDRRWVGQGDAMVWVEVRCREECVSPLTPALVVVLLILD
jgi:hypothetical protein